MKSRLFRSLSVLLLCAMAVSWTPIAAAASARFSDVPAGHWAAASIDRAVQTGLFQGQTATTFGLGRSMTRAAFAVVLCRLFRWETVTPAAGSYTDNQDRSAWYYSAVETAYLHGTLTDQSDRFRPADAVTREEMAVMLVRALGYTTIAGLSQKLSLPFTDVSSNAGYLTMAYELGIVSGTTATTFSPDRTATREQAAVMLMRVYDKYYAAAPTVCGILSDASDLPDLSGYSAVAVSAATLSVLSGSGRLNASMSSTAAETALTAIHGAGAKALLQVTGTETALSAVPADAAELIAAKVSAEGWDGVLLDIPALGEGHRAAYTALTAALNAALGTGTLYVTAEAPAWQGTAYGGYDYAALAVQADRLILRAASYAKVSGGFPTAPLEPLEELYYALAELRGTVASAKLSLWLTTTGSAWSGTSHMGSTDAGQIRQLLTMSSAEAYTSARYGEPYLTRTVNGTRTVIWFQDGDSAALRAQLAGFFGAGSFCLSDLSSVAEYPSGSVPEGLRR